MKKPREDKPRATKTMKKSGTSRSFAPVRKSADKRAKPAVETGTAKPKKTVRRSSAGVLGERPITQKRIASPAPAAPRKRTTQPANPDTSVTTRKPAAVVKKKRRPIDSDSLLKRPVRFLRKKDDYPTEKPERASGVRPSARERTRYEPRRNKNTREISIPSEDTPIRLNRYIANSGVCSRRDADLLIQAGEIRVNDKLITEMGYRVQKNDVVKYGNRVLNREKSVYVLLNKPKDYITTTEDPDERKTVMNLIKEAGDQRIYPVGRLDRNTTGVLLFTNDGELADKLSHPSNNVRKVYQVALDKPITEADFERIRQGVELEDGRANVDELAVVSPDASVLGIEIHSGRNRIVRRIFEYVGYDVVKLDRVSYAGLTKKDLPRGKWRFLTEKEIVRLKHFL